MGKKTLLALALAAVAALGTTSSAMAATVPSTNVTDFSAKITTAKLVLENLLPDGLEVPGSDPTLAGKTINVTGTISKAGKVSIAPSGFDFPEVSLGEAIGGISGISADIVLGQQASGTLTTTNGNFSLPLNLGVQLRAAFGELNITCLVKGLSFTFGTGNVTGWTSLFGAPWSSAGKSFALTGQSALPNLNSVPDADCPSAVKALAAGQLPAGLKVALKLSGTTTIGSTYKVPAVATLSGSASPTFSSAGKSSVKVKCAGSSTKNRACVGTVSVVVASKGVTVSAPFSASAGKTVTVPLTFGSGQKLAIRGASKASSVKVSSKLNIVVDNGKGVSNKSGSLTAKK
jgi:hypothetical protein